MPESEYQPHKPPTMTAQGRKPLEQVLRPSFVRRGPGRSNKAYPAPETQKGPSIHLNGSKGLKSDPSTFSGLLNIPLVYHLPSVIAVFPIVRRCLADLEGYYVFDRKHLLRVHTSRRSNDSTFRPA